MVGGMLSAYLIGRLGLDVLLMLPVTIRGRPFCFITLKTSVLRA